MLVNKALFYIALRNYKHINNLNRTEPQAFLKKKTLPGINKF